VLGDEMEKGKVKFFNDSKGFGFITRENGGKDIFVHFTGIVGDGQGRKSLKQDDEVEFEIEQTPKGPAAVQVTKI
jgi:CspA family cold shock protein